MLQKKMYRANSGTFCEFQVDIMCDHLFQLNNHLLVVVVLKICAVRCQHEFHIAIKNGIGVVFMCLVVAQVELA